jgi:hypothetical protein
MNSLKFIDEELQIYEADLIISFKLSCIFNSRLFNQPSILPSHFVGVASSTVSSD